LDEEPPEVGADTPVLSGTGLVELFREVAE
jgi:hypothetical protein